MNRDCSRLALSSFSSCDKPIKLPLSYQCKQAVFLDNLLGSGKRKRRMKWSEILWFLRHIVSPNMLPPIMKPFARNFVRSIPNIIMNIMLSIPSLHPKTLDVEFSYSLVTITSSLGD